jgi:chloride channel 3/4/5
MQVMNDPGELGGFSQTAQAGVKKKRSLSHWANFTTVSWRADAVKDFEEHTSVIMSHESSFVKIMHEAGTWAIPAFVGVATATSGAFIEKMVELWADLRFGFCTNFYTHPYMYALKENCESQGAWYEWGSPYVSFIIVSTLIATLSATLTWAFAPMSRGSGIPEIKTILGGFTFPEVLAGNTLVIKIIGLSMSVGAGLSCGKEGPLVHIACCWSNFLSKFFRRYRENEAKQRELLSAACAAGVAVAFGAPLGGVLFSLEEASTIFPTRTMLRSFFAGSMAALTLSMWNPTGTGKLTMFEAEYKTPPNFVEYPAIVVLGIVGGCVGACFVHYNIVVSKNRAPGTWFRSKCHIVLEVFLIGLITAITSYHLIWTRVLSNTTIKALFHDCAETSETLPASSSWLDLCVIDGDKGTPSVEYALMQGLFISGLLRFVQMIFTFGTGAAAGLFIPSLYVGAALGRIMGILLLIANSKLQVVSAIYPGMYAMLGAAAVLGGVCRVTISLVVIMFELTGGLQLIVPFMVVCMLAKWVGDAFTIGIYDYIIIIRKYPFLHEPDEVTYRTTAAHIMDEVIETIHPHVGTIDGFVKFLRQAKHGGYPLTVSPTDATFLGYLHTDALLKYLEKEWEGNVFITEGMKVEFSKFCEKKDPKSLDVSKLVDETVMCCVPETPAVKIQQIFRNLGVKIVLVKKKGKLVGMITKKSFITSMEELHHSGTCEKRSVGTLQEALLPK